MRESGIFFIIYAYVYINNLNVLNVSAVTVAELAAFRRAITVEIDSSSTSVLLTSSRTTEWRRNSNTHSSRCCTKAYVRFCILAWTCLHLSKCNAGHHVMPFTRLIHLLDCICVEGADPDKHCKKHCLLYSNNCIFLNIYDAIS